jgi:tetratricopeptide (TPR) repeat protein
VKDAVDAWVKVLAVDPDYEAAKAKLRDLVKRHGLEDHAIRALIDQGRDEHHDPLVLELANNRDAKARGAREKLVRDALQRAQAADRDGDTPQALGAWKEVLALDPKHLAGARRIVAIARQLNDHSALVEGLTAALEIKPGNTDLAQRLAAAALRAGQEQPVLEYLSRQGLADLSLKQMDGLHRRVLNACKTALKAADFDQALSCFRTLELADGKHPALEPLRPVLADKAASNAKGAEKQGNLAVAVPLAEQVLQIVPDQPVALLVVARDLWRHKRFSDIVKLCKPRVKTGPEYASVQKLLERAAAAA